MRRLATIFVLVACASMGAIDVLTVPRDSFAWTVVHTSPVELPVMRPTGTARTVFTATNLAGENTVQIEVPAMEDVAVWTPFTGRAPGADEVYTLWLDYYQHGATMPFSNETARVAVLRGVFGDAMPARKLSGPGRSIGQGGSIQSTGPAALSIRPAATTIFR